MKNRNLIIGILVLIILIIFVSSCTKIFNIDKNTSNKTKIVTTIFPVYDFTKQIANDSADIIMLLPAGVESHSYEPTPLDMKKISDADFFIYTGDEMEPWAESIVESIDNVNLVVIDTSQKIKMISQPDNDGKDHEYQLDPHLWLDPTLAMLMVENIKEVLCQKDAENYEIYSQNTIKFIEKLAKLDDDMQNMLDNAKRDTIVFGGRFAYAYLINRYDINYISAYENCSTHDEPSVKKIIEVIEFINQYEIKVVYHEELSEPKVAKSIEEQTGVDLLVLHTAHNVSVNRMKEGITYLDIMYENLENLRKGLN